MARDIALKVLRLDAGLEPAQMQEIEWRASNVRHKRRGA